jgi:hypothetical protein
MGVSHPTHYHTLGVGRHASPEQVRTAYRRRAQSCHPDKAPGEADAQAQMVQINQAYAVLSDPPGRAAYDRWIEAHDALLAAERAVWCASHPGTRAAWPWILLSATIAFSMLTVGTVLYKEVVPSVVAPPASPQAAVLPATGQPSSATGARSAAPETSSKDPGTVR